MTHPKSNLLSFLRGYFYFKSADWAGNTPQPLTSFTAPKLEKMPHYYIMPLDSSMPETIAQDMATEDPASVASKSTRWLPDAELDVYVKEWQRNGFQGGLNWYRIATDPSLCGDLNLFAGKTIDVPVLYIAGKQDWGTYQEPGAVEGMEKTCTEFHGVELVEGAGHWVMQERPEEVLKLVLKFLKEKEL
jgi:pimeloyl-ACP methyl ester carboxylesterase